MEKETVFVIYCSTGCSCCSSENHYRGPYKTREEAQKVIDSYFAPDSKFWPLASQYARRGRYSIQETLVETLPDGRKIIDNKYVTDDFDLDNPGILDIYRNDY